MKLISKTLRMHVLKGSQFYLPPTRLCTNGTTILPLLSAAEHHRILAGTHFPSRGRSKAELA